MSSDGCSARRRDQPGQWILGHGWNQNNWLEGLPTAAELDEVAPFHPVHLTHVSLHSSWENSRALKTALIHAGTQDPKNGKIVRNESGEPTGVLLETASKLVDGVIPATSAAEDIQAIADAQKALWEVGVTSVHDFDRIPCFIALQCLHQNDELKLRVLKTLPVESLEESLLLGCARGLATRCCGLGGSKCLLMGRWDHKPRQC